MAGRFEPAQAGGFHHLRCGLLLATIGAHGPNAQALCKYPVRKGFQSSYGVARSTSEALPLLTEARVWLWRVRQNGRWTSLARNSRRRVERASALIRSSDLCSGQVNVRLDRLGLLWRLRWTICRPDGSDEARAVECRQDVADDAQLVAADLLQPQCGPLARTAPRPLLE